MLRKITLLATLSLGIGFAQAQTTLLNVSYDPTRELYKDFNAAFNAGDAEAIAALVAPDGIWMPPGAAAIVGRENVKERYAAQFKKVQAKFELKPGGIQLCGDWAFISGPFSRADTLKAGGPAKNFSGHYLFVLKKQPGGAWKIARDIWNEGEAKTESVPMKAK